MDAMTKEWRTTARGCAALAVMAAVVLLAALAAYGPVWWALVVEAVVLGGLVACSAFYFGAVAGAEVGRQHGEAAGRVQQGGTLAPGLPGQWTPEMMKQVASASVEAVSRDAGEVLASYGLDGHLRMTRSDPRDPVDGERYTSRPRTAAEDAAWRAAGGGRDA